MPVFAFCRQDGLGRIRFAGFCQVKSRRKECPVMDFRLVQTLFILARQEWLKGVYGRSGKDMEA